MLNFILKCHTGIGQCRGWVKHLNGYFVLPNIHLEALKTIQIDLWQKIMETVASKVGVEEEKHLIELTLNDYLQGRPIKDIERLRGAFHADAYIRTIIEGKLVQWTLPQYLDLVVQATLQECQPELLSYTWDGEHGVGPRAIDFCHFSVH